MTAKLDALSCGIDALKAKLTMLEDPNEPLKLSLADTSQGVVASSHSQRGLSSLLVVGKQVSLCNRIDGPDFGRSVCDIGHYFLEPGKHAVRIQNKLGVAVKRSNADALLPPSDGDI